MVLQDTWLFSGSVLENVRYGSEDASREEVERVCREAKVASFVEKLPAGYDTVLTDNAVNISKGQKQLITIARAMLSAAPMLILDEATSNVDTRTEQDIQAAMERLMEGRTCFVIAHRLSTIRHAKNILVMDHGDVVEQGTHEELLARGGTYASYMPRSSTRDANIKKGGGACDCRRRPKERLPRLLPRRAHFQCLFVFHHAVPFIPHKVGGGDDADAEQRHADAELPPHGGAYRPAFVHFHDLGVEEHRHDGAQRKPRDGVKGGGALFRGGGSVRSRRSKAPI